MKKRTRTEYSFLNIATGIGGYILNTILGFACRMVFVRCLSADYLGVNGLFTNILTMLSLTELGIGSAIGYALYKPLAENDEEKIASFAKGYATVLFFEDQDVVANLQRNFPLYADSFPLWSLQSSGMLQYMVWAALENEGAGASLQHYNPLIDDAVAAEWKLPASWKLISQMPVGSREAPAGEKTFEPIEKRVKVFK